MGGAVEITAYKQADISQMLDIWNEIIIHNDAYLYDKPFMVEEFQEMLQQQTAVNCACLDGKIAGFYILHPNHPGKGSHVANATYAVSSAFRQKGVGKALGNHSLLAAKSHGYKAMQFNAVVKSNLSANILWQSMGFEVIGESPKAYRQKDGTYTSLMLYYKYL